MSRLLNKIKGNSSSNLTQQAQENANQPSDGLRDVPMSEFLSLYVKSYVTSITHTHGNPSKVPYPMQYYLPKTYLSLIADFKMDHISLLNNAVFQQDAVSRFLNVLQYHMTTINLTKFPYKPFFPRMGESLEVFTQTPQHGQTTFVSEQLHTDPAFTAYHIYNDQLRIVQSGTFEMNPSFHTSRVDVEFKAPTKTRFLNFNEEYISDWPSVSIYLMKAKTELSGTSTLSCSNGLKATLSFNPKEKSCHGTVTHNGVLMFELNGIWDGQVQIINSNTKEARVFMDRRVLAKDQMLNPPMESLPPTASQRLRYKLLTALQAKDYETAKASKLELEHFSAQPHLFVKQNNGEYQYVKHSF